MNVWSINKRLFEHFLPNDLSQEGVATASRIRVLTTAYLLVTLPTLALSVLNVLHQEWHIVAVNGLLLTGITFGLYSTKQKRLFVSSAIFCSFVITILPLIVYFRGTLAHPSAHWFLMIPTISIVLLNRKQAWLTLLLSIITVWLPVLGYIWIDRVSPSQIEKEIFEGTFLNVQMIITSLLADAFQQINLKYQRILRKVNRKAKRAQKDAERAAEAEHTFLAKVSHEIRTPLNGLLGSLASIDESPLSSEDRRLFGVLRDSADTLLGLLNDLLDSSSLQSGELKIRNADFLLLPVFEQLVDLYRSHAANRKIDLQLNHALSPQTLAYGDAARITQIGMNLLSNALKFTPKGGRVEIQVTADATENQSHLCITVKDTGTGIPKEQQSRIFQKFSQAENQNIAGDRGTGLGLFIVKSLVEQMRGNITFQSSPSEGTEFKITLPLSLRMGPCTHLSHKEREEESLIQGASSPPLHVLIVDDNPVNRLVAGRLLRKFNCTPVEAESARAALLLLEKEQFDFILMDVHMPEMDGIEATRKILQRWPNQFIVGHSASLLPDEIELYRQAGMQDFLGKPIQREKLQELLRSMENLNSA